MQNDLKIGAKVRIADGTPPGHIRTPSFVKGRTGVIARHYGRYPNPERLAYGLSGLPKLNLYQVLFEMDETWEGSGDYGPRDTLTVDIYETWLEVV